MKLQNLSLIFLVVAIPLILILSYYLNLQQDTLELQAQYDLKLAEATKEGIKAFEVNTVDWTEWTNNQTNVTRRNNAMATINTFLTSLSNNLNISGTAKEYITNYIPATAVTMYDGYYVYAPTYVPIPCETPEGVQLYYDKDENNDGIENDGILTDDSEMGVNLPAYKASSTAIDYEEEKYKYMNSEDNEITSTETVKFVTDINQAQTEYKHILSNQIPYSARYSKTSPNTNVIVNYTLDNRIYVFGTIDGEYIEKDGYLVYFDSAKTKLPMINVTTPDPKNDGDIKVWDGVSTAKYGDTYIEPEILEEQILYKDDAGNYQLETFKYVYNIKDEKLYYDEGNKRFFRLRSDKTKDHISETAKPTGSNMTGCEFKSVSVLWGDNGDTTEYKKIYQLLNGPDQGKWYISIKEDPISMQQVGTEQIDTKLGSTKVTELGLSESTDASNICKVYSATSYYVEAYAFTNWVRQNLGGVKQELYSETDNKYNPTSIQVEGANVDIFDINKNNDPEQPYSPIVLHKKQLMKDHITTNLNLSISNYGRGTYQFKMPVLTDNDWEQAFSNISLITFFQGIPIGLKYYNSYAIATSNTNREYVDPGELYFTGADNTETDNAYHRVYCKECHNIVYTGYRSVEYSMREYTQYDDVTKDAIVGPFYYYQHDKYNGDNNSETACYYCLVNKENFEYSTDPNIQYIQTKAYNEALARERYYQKETLQAKLNAIIIYIANIVEDGKPVKQVTYVPPPQEVEVGKKTNITSEEPTLDIDIQQKLKFVFMGWSEDPNAKYDEVQYAPGAEIQINEAIEKKLYAIWEPNLASMDWNTDFKWEGWENEPFNDTMHGSEGGSSHISRIDVKYDDLTGSTVRMHGNYRAAGKGAAWTTFIHDYYDVSAVEFNYYLNVGHSFTTAGFMFNVEDTGDTLTGYIVEISFGGSEPKVYSFTYKKNDNSSANITKNTVGVSDTAAADRGTQNGGSVKVSVNENGYIVEISDKIITIDCKADGKQIMPNTFGFFSTHHGHGCNNIGLFRIDNIHVSLVKEK